MGRVKQHLTRGRHKCLVPGESPPPAARSDEGEASAPAHAVLAAVAVVEGGVEQLVPDAGGAHVRGHARHVGVGPGKLPTVVRPARTIRRMKHLR